MADRESNISFKNKMLILIFSYGFHATAIYRLGHYLYSGQPGHGWNVLPCIFNYLLALFYWPLHHLVRIFYDININPRSIIGESFYVGHFGGIYIGPNCVIGNTCSIQQHVVIGPGLDEDDGKTIKLGNRVWIGAHTRIDRDVLIQDCATVSAGSEIREGTTVKGNSLIMGAPARMVLKNYDNSSML